MKSLRGKIYIYILSSQRSWHNWKRIYIYIRAIGGKSSRKSKAANVHVLAVAPNQTDRIQVSRNRSTNFIILTARYLPRWHLWSRFPGAVPLKLDGSWWKLMEVDGSWWNHHVAMLFAWRPSPSFPMESSGHQSDWFSLSLRGTRHGTIQFSSSSKWNRIPSPVWMGSVSSFLFLSSSLSLTSIIRNDIIVIIIPCFFCSRIMSGGINSCRRALSNLQSNKWNNSFTSSAGGGEGRRKSP